MNNYSPTPALDTVTALSPFVRIFIESALIAMFYTGFVKSKLWSGKTAFLAFGGAFFLFQLFARIIFHDNIEFPAPIIRIIILMCATFLLANIFFKANIKLHLFLLISFFAVQELSFFIAYSVRGLVEYFPIQWLLSALESEAINIEEFIRYFQVIMICGLVLQKIIYLLIIFVSLRKIKQQFLHKSLSTSELIFLILPCLSGLILSFIIRTIIHRPDIHEVIVIFVREIQVINAFIALAGIVLLFSMIASIRAFQNLTRAYADEKERAVLQNQMQQLQGQINDVNGFYTEIKGMRHDMKSHLANIRVLVKSVMSGNTDADPEEYLGKFEEALDMFDFVFQTGNAVSDIIIHQKYLESKSKGIDFSAEFLYPTHFNIDAYDLAIILNNSLENAIEACDGAKNGYVKLYAYVKGEMFFVEIENSFTGERAAIDKITGLPQSTKSHDGLHGMGLANIQRCARKYLGDIDLQISQDENIGKFHLTVMLQSKA